MGGAMERTGGGTKCPGLLRATSVSGFFANANSFSGDSARSALRGALPVNSGDVWILFGQPIKQARRQLILCEPQSDGFVNDQSFELIQRKNKWKIQRIWKTHLPLPRGLFPPSLKVTLRAKTSRPNPSAPSTTEPPLPRTATGGPIKWTCRFSTNTPTSPTRWARSSTTPRNSRASI